MFFCVKCQICAVFCTFITCSLTQEFKYKVIAPKYICINNNMSQSEIRLIGDDIPNLKYNWSVSFQLFQTNEKKNLKQRHVLMVWTSVRQLNEILQNLSEEDINRGVIYINNSLLTPDVKYIINLTVEKQMNNITKRSRKRITIEYLENINKSTLFTYLSGPEVIYSDMTYTAKAEVSSCSDNSHYKFLWQILDKYKKVLKEESTKSNILKLLPGTFLAGKEYFLKCYVLDTEFNKTKSSEVLWVNVLEREMQLTTFTKHLKIGINQPIYLNAFFNDPDSIVAELTFKWSCSDSSNNSCQTFKSNNSTELSIPKGLPTPGRYLFMVTATKGTKNVNDVSEVEVVEEMVPVIDIENALTSCNPSDAVKISAHVGRLVPGCTLQWISVNDSKEYDFVDLGKLPNKPGYLLNVTEDDNTIEDFSEEKSNSDETFFDTQYDFLLPTSVDGSWIGLKDDSKYLFRLTASCLCTENNSSENFKDKFVVSSADVEIRTNKLPVLQPLKVSPKSGQALKTKFSFQTGHPFNNTKPLLYKYGILNKTNNTLYFLEQYDVTSAQTILPFYDESVQTVLEVCDSKNACSYTFGPKVIVELPNNFTATEINSLLNNFNKSMSEQDYFNAFTLSSMLLQTAKQMKSNEIFNTFDTTIKNITKKEIESFDTSEGDSWLLPAIDLLKNIKLLDNDTSLSEDMLNDILALRDKISEKQYAPRKKQIKSEKLIAVLPPSRKLLSFQISKKSKRIVNEINLDEIKNYLEISEFTIKRFNDFERVDSEKQKLKEKLQYYMPRICQFLYNNYKTNVRIEISTIVFDVEKLNLVRKYNNILSIPFDLDLAAKLQIGRDLAERYRRQKGICLAKILFLDDYFNIPQFVYDIKLYTALSDDYLESEINKFSITIELPIKSPVSNNQMFQCVLWESEDNNWDMSKCKTIEEYSGSVKCSCKALGYFSIVPVERSTTQTTRSTTTSSSTLKTSQILDLFTQQYNVDTTRLTTVHNARITKQQYHVTVTTVGWQITSTEHNREKSQYKVYQNDEKNVNTATIWSISLLTIGIVTLFLAFLVLLRKLQKSKAIQSFQSIEYARYFDEHNLE